VNGAPQQSKQSQIVAQQQLQQHFTREQLAHHHLAQQHAAMKNGMNAANGGHPYLNAASQQHAQQLSNGVFRNGTILPQPQGYPGLHSTSNGTNVASPMNMPPNMPLKMPPRQLQWSRPGQTDVNGGAPNGNPTGSPIMQHHLSSPNLAGRSSPVRMNGALPDRISPMNPHAPIQQLPHHQPSPLMDVHHGTPQLAHRVTASPHSDLAMLQQPQQHRQSQSPHLTMRSPVHQHQMLSNSTG